MLIHLIIINLFSIDVFQAYYFKVCFFISFYIVVPPKDPPTLIFTNAANLQHIYMNGSLVRSTSVIKVVERTAVDFNHRNETICWVCIFNILLYLDRLKI